MALFLRQSILILCVTAAIAVIAHGAVAPVQNRAPLEPSAFVALPLGSVRAQGWLQRQLQLQKSGLTGSAEKLYDALTPDSGWLGGKGENWEKGPYYIRGLIALAYTLDDAELKARAQKWIDWALQSQKPDGSFGPAANDDWWPRMVVLWYLRDYYEATGDERVVPFFTKYFHYQLEQLPGRPLRDWGRSRAGDNIDIVLWTYNRTGDASLIELAKLLQHQAYPWSDIFAHDRFYGFGKDFQPHHIVNVNQAMKFSPVVWQFTHDAADKSALAEGMTHLDRDYGRIDGQISGTEMLSGRKTTDGVELCADIERIISNGVAINALGEAGLADVMEKVAYNSLPAHTSPTMRQITYYQLLNQISAVNGGHGFHEDYSNGNVPGPHSGFPCCCYNWHAGWPTFVKNMWSATPDGGLALIAYGPNRVTATVAGDVPITITQITDYPFDGTINLKVEPQRAAKFPLVLRVPNWCKTPQIAVNGQDVEGVKPWSFKRIEREWHPGDVVTLNFPMDVVRPNFDYRACVERGPLAFGLAIGEKWNSIRSYPDKFDEYEVTATTPWNYALVDGGNASLFKVQTQPVGEVPWSTEQPPVTLTMQARRLPGWGVKGPAGSVILGKSDHHWQPLAEVPVPLDANGTHQLTVKTHGKLIEVSVDGNPVLSHEDDSFTRGQVGLRAYNTAADYARVSANDTASLGGKAYGGTWSDNGSHTDLAKDAKLLFEKLPPQEDVSLTADIKINPGGDAGFIFRATDLANKADGYRGYYVGLRVKGGQGHDAAEPPQDAVTSDQPLETIKLIPFGSAKLRISYFPTLK